MSHRGRWTLPCGSVQVLVVVLVDDVTAHGVALRAAAALPGGCVRGPVVGDLVVLVLSGDGDDDVSALVDRGGRPFGGEVDGHGVVSSARVTHGSLGDGRG